MNILAVGAHPDDIEFGCGGALLQYADKGHQIFLMTMTDGGVGGEAAVRRQEQEASVQFMGAKKVYWGGFHDTHLPEVSLLISGIERVIREVAPQMVLVNYLYDVHQDHRATAQACLSATRYIQEVLYYEVPTTQHFEPDIFVDIGAVLERKVELLRRHESQMHRTHVENLSIVESVQSCANFRGYQGRVKYAEGFKAVRILRHIPTP